MKGIHNIKAGVTYEQTFLTEHDRLGIVDPTLNAPCLTLNSAPSQYNISDPYIPVQGFTDPSQCAGAGYQENVSSNTNAPNTASIPIVQPGLAAI